MNFIATSFWLASMTWLGYLIGEKYIPEHLLGVTVAFFILAFIIRFYPKLFGHFFSEIID